MKECLSILLVIINLFSLTSCSGESIESPVFFYYMQKEFTYYSHDDVIGYEIREGNQIKDIRNLLSTYLQGPESQTLDSPFPTGTQFINAAKGEHALVLTLSDEFAALTGIELTLACCCLAKTVMNYTGETAVQIQVESDLLDGESSIVMDSDSVILFDTIAPSRDIPTD